MVGGISNISIPAPNYAVASYGKMTLPVEASSLIYSNFEHVLGVPAPEGTRGVAISKLNLLDVLIEQLNRIQKDSFSQSMLNPNEDIDALVESLKLQIKQVQSSAEQTPYNYFPTVETGILVNFLT